MSTPKNPVAPKSDMPAPGEITALVKGNNNFALELWGRAGTGNQAMSPASISTALAMAWAGAKGTTAEQMKKVLHFEGTNDEIVQQWARIALALQDANRPFKLRLANRLYGDKHYSFDTIYFTITRKVFDAPLEMVDFQGAAEEQRQKINKWVAERTEQRIKDLLPPRMIDSSTRLVLVNALYFLADWDHPFEQQATFDQPFHGVAKQVPTMHASGQYLLARGEGAALLELPYKGGSAAMYVLLPDKKDGLAAIEHKLAPTIKALQLKLASKQVTLALPKFTIDPSHPLELSSQLAALGMPDAFDAAKSDFTGIANPPKPDDRLAISAVLHKAFVKVDEKGTEAAAATAVVAVAGSAPPPAPREQFIADHPFLFLIVDKSTGLILFIGRVVEPS